MKQTYGAGNCHLLQINSKRAGQTMDNPDGTINMPDPWRLYVKQSTVSNSSIAQTNSSITDSVYNSAELIDQEGNTQSNVLRSFKTLMSPIF